MNRFALWACLVAVPAIAADFNIGSMLEGVERRYNRPKTIRVLFEQTYRYQGHREIRENGQLSLRRPGKMRWEYVSPKGKLFVSNGDDVFLYSPNTNRVERMSVKESADMRAPLAFLLGNLDFRRDFGRFLGRPEGADVWIVADPKSDQFPYTQVAFLVTPQHRIRRLEVTGQDKSVLTYTFDKEVLNPPLDDALFQFKAPPGAESAEVEP